MSNFSKEIALLTTIFANNSNEKTQKQQERYLLNNFPFYGILTAKRKPLTNPLIKQWHKTLNVEQKKQLFAILYHQHHREFQYTAMEFLALWWQNNLTFNDLDWLLTIIKYHMWWDTIDYFDHIMGVLIFSMPNDDIKCYLQKLITTDNFWLQRLAMQTQLMFKEKMNIDLLFTLITPLLTTNNFYLIRSIGWTLRNAQRVDSNKVAAFISKNNVNNKIMRVIKEH